MFYEVRLLVPNLVALSVAYATCSIAVQVIGHTNFTVFRYQASSSVLKMGTNMDQKLYIHFRDFMAVIVQIVVIWVVTSCSLIGKSQWSALKKEAACFL
jgi:ABC-type uncharacterized transport system permease subunit